MSVKSAQGLRAQVHRIDDQKKTEDSRSSKRSAAASRCAQREPAMHKVITLQSYESILPISTSAFAHYQTEIKTKQRVNVPGYVVPEKLISPEE